MMPDKEHTQEKTLNHSVVLLCTVGGSHAPLVRAIETLRPDMVGFLCSEDDVATGQKGSYVQILGKGNIIKRHPGDAKPSLPNIPTQLGLAGEQYAVLKVPADDFDSIYKVVQEWLQEHQSSSSLVADYTGGTKTMSAALVAAALEQGHVKLQLVTGPRGDLKRVVSGEQVLPASVERSRFQRRFQQAVSAWQHFAYDDSVVQLRQISSPFDNHLRGQLQRALAMSEAFAAWDRFDHAGALALLSPYRPRLGARSAPLMNQLGLMNKDVPAREVLLMYDLWRNAQRRMHQGRYDDAVGRFYRMLEWSAQWLLREMADIETANVDKEKIPPRISLAPNRQGGYQAGLHVAWQLAAHHCGSLVADFWQSQEKVLMNHLMIRNHSILAHGFAPVKQEQCKVFADWIANQLIPLMLKISEKQPWCVKTCPQQLPTDYASVAGL